MTPPPLHVYAIPILGWSLLGSQIIIGLGPVTLFFLTTQRRSMALDFGFIGDDII